MASYVVTGASRGLGFEFIRQLSADPKNTVIALVRNVEGTKKRVAEEINRPNIHVVHGDVTDYESLVKSAEEVSKITGGSLDYLIANAGDLGHETAFHTLGQLASDPKLIDEICLRTFKTNALGNIHLFNLYIPLIRKGKAKKVITISTGMADDELTRKYELAQNGPYSISKAAVNTVVAKFHAEYAKEGIFFLAICPGMVDTGNMSDMTEQQQQAVGVLTSKFLQYAPHFKGPAQPEESIRDVLSVVNKTSLETGHGGAYISHLGTKQWL